MEKSLSQNLLGLLSKYRWRFLSAFCMVLTSNLLLILNPLIFREAIHTFDPSSKITQNWIGETTHWLLGEYVQAIPPWVFLLITIAIISSFFKYWMRFTFISISRDAEKDIREKLFGRIQSQSREFFDHHGVGELLSRLTNDITAYRELLGPGIMYPLFFLTIVTPGLIALFSISTPLALLSIVPILLIPFLNGAVRDYIYRYSRSVQVSLGEMSNMTQEYFSGIRIVKGYAIEQETLKKFRNLCKQFSLLSYKLACIQGLLYPLFTLLTRTVTVSLVLLAGYIILKAWHTLSAADFASFMWIQSYIFIPVLMLGWILPVYERGRAAYSRLIEVYEEPVVVRDNQNSTLKVPSKADIKCVNLTFSYPKAEFSSLSNLNLHIAGGTFVGITGPVGSGKTTLLHLINREYEIPDNMLYIGGHEIHEYSLETLKNEIITVEQVSFLFSRTVAENVRFGRLEATQDELETVARFADLHDTVTGFPEQYATLVGERGMTLSGGQKQRVALARAFLVNREILLLDDIFSALDTATEKRIFKSIKEHFQGKTVLLVTHRISILDQMDRIIYMSHGHIQEDGSPEQLRKLNGHYAALAELQRMTEESK